MCDYMRLFFQCVCENHYINKNLAKKIRQSVIFATMNQSKNRKIIFLRHGERLDNTFGSSWIQEEYVRTDLNMPESLPQRETNHWRIDTPLTMFGEIQAQFVGSSLKKSGIKFTQVFVSPAYRCLQTATNVLKGMEIADEFALKVDPGLFEWTGFLRGGLSKTVFLSADEAAKFFNIDQSYRPVMSQSQLDDCMTESIDEFYERNFQTTAKILDKFNGDILVVGHGIGLETYTRQLVGKKKRSTEELRELVTHIPYLAAVAVEQIGTSYRLAEPPCLPITQDSSMRGKTSEPIERFDWRILESN